MLRWAGRSSGLETTRGEKELGYVVPKAVVDNLFNKADTDGSGNIDIDELKRMAAAGGQVLSDSEAATMMSAMDTDGDGVIDIAEFTAFLNSGNNGNSGSNGGAAATAGEGGGGKDGEGSADGESDGESEGRLGESAIEGYYRRMAGEEDGNGDSGELGLYEHCEGEGDDEEEGGGEDGNAGESVYWEDREEDEEGGGEETGWGSLDKYGTDQRWEIGSDGGSVKSAGSSLAT